jgi:hypothetical protein
MFGHWLISWHWGSIAPVVVALVALAVSAWFNRRTLRQAADLNQRTLRQSADQFATQRLDAREDKLRAEIASLSAALTQRSAQLDILVSRAVELRKSLDELDEIEQKRRYYLSAKVIFAESVSGLYTTIFSHATTIKMLTNDEAITKLVDRITKACNEESEHYERLLNLSSEPLLGTREYTEHIAEVIDSITVSRQQLVHLGRKRWATS